MSLHVRIIGEKTEREGVKGSHQQSSVVIHIGIFFCPAITWKGRGAMRCDSL